MYRNLFARMQNLGRGNILNRNQSFVRRWPLTPKVAFYGPPNTFIDEISMR